MSAPASSTARTCEFLRRIGNPVGVKLGPERDRRRRSSRSASASIPNARPGRLMLVSRMGADSDRRALPPLAACGEARAATRCVWMCDPMHGNTFQHASGYKTRDFDDVMRELHGFFAACDGADVWPGGVHVELTGENVTECLGGATRCWATTSSSATRRVRPAAQRPPVARPRVPGRRAPAPLTSFAARMGVGRAIGTAYRRRPWGRDTLRRSRVRTPGWWRSSTSDTWTNPTSVDEPLARLLRPVTPRRPTVIAPAASRRRLPRRACSRSGAPRRSSAPAPAPAPVAPAGRARAAGDRAAAPRPGPMVLDGDEPEPLRGAAARTVENMEASLQVPTATSVRAIPAKLLEVNRQILNNQLAAHRRGQGELHAPHRLRGAARAGRLPRVSTRRTATEGGKPVVVRHHHVNLGLAVDVQKPRRLAHAARPEREGGRHARLRGFLGGVRRRSS